MPDQIICTPQCVVTEAVERAPLAAPAQAGATPLRGVPRQDDDLEPDPAPAEPWADEDLEKFYAEYVEMFDEQDALEGTDLPICDESSCPVPVCPFEPGAGGLSDDELIDAMASCELSPFHVERQRGIPGLASALGQAGWSVHRIGDA